MPHAVFLEDRPETIRTFTKLAERFGFSFEVFPTVGTFRDYLEDAASKPDLVVLDMMLHDEKAVPIGETQIPTQNGVHAGLVTLDVLSQTGEISNGTKVSILTEMSGLSEIKNTAKSIARINGLTDRDISVFSKFSDESFEEFRRHVEDIALSHAGIEKIKRPRMQQLAYHLKSMNWSTIWAAAGALAAIIAIIIAL